MATTCWAASIDLIDFKVYLNLRPENILTGPCGQLLWVPGYDDSAHQNVGNATMQNRQEWWTAAIAKIDFKSHYNNEICFYCCLKYLKLGTDHGISIFFMGLKWLRNYKRWVRSTWHGPLARYVKVWVAHDRGEWVKLYTSLGATCLLMYRSIMSIYNYSKTSNIRCTKSPKLNDSRLVLQLSLPIPLKPAIKSRMKM